MSDNWGNGSDWGADDWGHQPQPNQNVNGWDDQHGWTGSSQPQGQQQGREWGQPQGQQGAYPQGDYQNGSYLGQQNQNMQQGWGQQPKQDWNNQHGHQQPQEQHVGNAESSQNPPSKLKTTLATIGVLLVIIGFIWGMIALAKMVNKDRNTPTAEQIEQVVESSSSVASSSSVVESSSSTMVGTSDSSVENSSSSQSSADLGGSGVSQQTIEGATISGTVLQNTGVINSIKLVVENDLLATYHVDVAMGSTVLPLVLNYEQANGLSVGDMVTIQYSKVEGHDKVVVVSIAR